MMTMFFGDGTAVEYEHSLEAEEFWAGSSRRVLTVTCHTDAISVDKLSEIIDNSDNLEKLTMTNDDVMVEGGKRITVTNTLDGYVMKMKCGIEKILVQPEAPTSQAVYEDRLVFKLGRPTFIEQQLARLGVAKLQ